MPYGECSELPTMSTPLVSVSRGELVESLHRGHIAVVDSRGKVLWQAGNPMYVTYFRSSAKPLQVLPIIESGAVDRYAINDRELTVMAASHHGEDCHVEAVMSILGKIGLEESCLKCGVHMPTNRMQAARLVKEGISVTPVYNNCSGKHAGMLAYAMHNGYPIDNYLDRENPVQVNMWKAVAEVSGLPPEKVVRGVDGCGVVVFGMPIANMAYAYARLADPGALPECFRDPAQRMTSAMIEYPEMIGGSSDFGSNLMRNCGGTVFAKGGAEGLFCVGVPRLGIGIAVKIEDGGSRGLQTSVMEVLRLLDIAGPEMLNEEQTSVVAPIRNCRKEVVGEITPCFELTEGQSSLAV
jgi:L-asparaginase II